MESALQLVEGPRAPAEAACRDDRAVESALVDPDQEAASRGLRMYSEVLQERRSCLRFGAKGHVSDEELDEALARLEENQHDGAGCSVLIAQT